MTHAIGATRIWYTPIECKVNIEQRYNGRFWEDVRYIAKEVDY